jgi:hypothetical protein
MNRMRITTLMIFLFAFCGSFAVAADRPHRFEKPEDVVAWLYRDFGWEALIWHYFGKDTLVNQPMNVLKRYFTSRLAELIVKDREHATRTKQLGHIDFMLIFGSQDPYGISNIRITRKPGTNVVSVLYDYNREKDVMRIDFETIQTGNGWRISDMHYKTRKSHAFPDPGVEFSLLGLLSQPYE